jgi:GAF domain-containing protein
MYFKPQLPPQSAGSTPNPLQDVVQRLNQKLHRDRLVQTTTDDLRRLLNVDRVVLYHFYTEWEGRVTFESLSDLKWSIFGSTGPAQCFTDEYAALYLAGRVRAISNIETETIQPCHRDFLRDLNVRANLVVPILTEHRLWGLLVAHHCTTARSWTPTEIDQMTIAAQTLASAPSINNH